MESFNIIDILLGILTQFIAVVPNILGAIVIFLVGWIIAKIVAKVIKKVLVSLKVDKVAEKLNEIEFIEKSNVNIVPSTVLSKLFYYLLMLIFAIAASETLGMQAVSDLIKDLIAYIPNVVAAMIFMVIGLLFANFIKGLVSTALKSLGVPSANMIANLLFYFLILTILMSALAQAKINTEFLNSNITLILAGAVAAFAFGYGFASRDLVANFLASFYSKGKINLGDTITLDGMTGEVIAVENTSLTLKSNDKHVIIPLSKLTAGVLQIHNKS